jgi:Flavin-binding monooxygenase-like
VYPERYMHLVRQRTIDLRVSTVERFTETAAVLASGDVVPADVVIFATGYKYGLDFLDAELRASLRAGADGMYLYRGVLPPSVPGIACVLSSTLTFTAPTTAALQAAWLGEALCGRMALPSTEAMAAEVARVHSAQAATHPASPVRSACVLAQLHQYNHQLIRDMGRDPGVFGGPFGWLANALVPFEAAHVAGCLEPGGSSSCAGKLPPPRLFSAAMWGWAALFVWRAASVMLLARS